MTAKKIKQQTENDSELVKKDESPKDKATKVIELKQNQPILVLPYQEGDSRVYISPLALQTLQSATEIESKMADVAKNIFANTQEDDVPLNTVSIGVVNEKITRIIPDAITRLGDVGVSVVSPSRFVIEHAEHDETIAARFLI